MTNIKRIGMRVRAIRQAAQIDQETLAAIIGVSRSTIAGIETGRDRGGIATMIAIADYFKVPMDWLLDRRLPEGSPPVGTLVYRPDQEAILFLWDQLPFDQKQAWLDRLGFPTDVGPASRIRPRRSAAAD